jgi:hypothetical protein
MKKNAYEINKGKRSMHRTIKYEVLKKSFEIIFKWFSVMTADKE